MAPSFTKAFDHIITLFQQTVEDVSVIYRDENNRRGVLKLTGHYRGHTIHLREIIRVDGSRKYAYYVIQAGQVIAGFDNAPDAQALRLKYGDTYTQHRLETVPHHHLRDKQQLELTDEMDCQAFLNWLEQHL